MVSLCRFYGRYVKRVVGGCKLFQLHAHQGRVAVQAHAHHDYLSVVYLEPMAHPCAFESRYYLLGGEVLGVYELVDAHARGKARFMGCM